MSYKPLLRAFEGKLKCAELMARQKGMDFSVEDDTTATEAGLLKGALRWTANVTGDLEANTSPAGGNYNEGYLYVILSNSPSFRCFFSFGCEERAHRPHLRIRCGHCGGPFADRLGENRPGAAEPPHQCGQNASAIVH